MTFKHLQCCSKRLRLPVSGHPEPLFFCLFSAIFQTFSRINPLVKKRNSYILPLFYCL